MSNSKTTDGYSSEMTAHAGHESVASVVWDNHACMPLRPADQSFLPELNRHRRAGAHIVMLNVGCGNDSAEQIFAMLTSLRSWIAQRPNDYLLIESLADISRTVSEQKLGIGFDIEGTAFLSDQLDRLQQFHELGVKWISLAYNKNNLAAGGCQDDDKGLTPFGKQLLCDLGKVGVVACASHTGYRSAREAIDASPTPVIFSHSNPRALCDHPRNIPDDLIRACANRGGVIGINGVGIFLGGNDALADRVVRHIEYVAELVGIQYVGLGLDYVFDQKELADFVAANPEVFPADLGYGRAMSLLKPNHLVDISAALDRRGFASGEIASVLGMNWVRHAHTVWRA